MAKYNYIIFETYDISLSLELQNKIVREVAFLEKEIWGMLFSTVLVLAAFQEKNLIHGEICPDNILCKQFDYKIFYPP